MSQKLRDDKITALNHSAGNITLAAGAYITVGGQQYTNASQLLVALPALTANGLYMIYATVSGGALQLTISQNVNSVGPTGFLAWKLIGAFYANGALSVAFGSFVNIDGPPESNWVSHAPMVITATSVNPTKASVVDVDIYRWKRVGDSIELFWTYVAASVAGATGGTGTYRFGMPTNILSDTTKFNQSSSSINGSRMGKYSGYSSSQTRNFTGFYWAVSSSLLAANAFSDNLISNDIQAGFNPTTDMNSYELNALLPISGWTNTPLKDL